MGNDNKSKATHAALQRWKIAWREFLDIRSPRWRLSILSGFWMIYFFVFVACGIAIRAAWFPGSVLGSYAIVIVAAGASGMLAFVSCGAFFRRLDRHRD